MRSILFAIVGLFSLSAWAADPVLAVDVVGRLTEDGVGVDDVRDLNIVVRNDNGDVVLEQDEVGHVLVDGRFAVSLDLDAEALDEAAAGTLLVETRIGEATAVTSFGAVAQAQIADHAIEAATASRATRLGLLTGVELIGRSALAASGGATVSYDNVVSRPAGIDDGDQGNVVAVTAPLQIVGGQLQLASGSITSAQIVDGTVGTAALRDNDIASDKVANLGATKVAAGSLTGADFAPQSFATADVAGSKVSLFSLPLACDFAQGLTTASTCAANSCGSAGLTRNCSTFQCDGPAGTRCNTTALGQLLFAQ